ncbi:hypothetical protein QE152_g13436 [Popillia japonica]|uniref:Endonuclease/exonuclease/phosphatase domain-containing protein n=1 Tax=Popillia japonica TaxID=7064 RepID=A0AAW1LC82_POPJA
MEIVERKVIIGGDWNARTGIMGDPYIDELGDQVVRESKDKVVNGEGRKMMGWLSRNDWRCLNGCAKDDLCDEYTYVGARVSSVIDYVVVSDNVWERVDEFKVGDMSGSDHFPLECVFEGVAVKRYTSARKKVSCSSERGIQRYRENLGKVRFGEVVSIEQLLECVRKSVCKKERRDEVKPGWFDAECMIAKRGLREVVSRFRLSQIDRMQLLEERRMHDSKKRVERSGE